MKEKLYYVCECCNKEFNNIAACNNHESQHIKIDSINTVRFDEKDALPYVINVTLSDGTSVDYYLPEDMVNPKIQ